jgi:transcriptional regulator with XRE-family HTH domain
LGSRRIPRVADRGNLPQALKLLRTRLDVNRIDLGRKLGLSKQQFYSYEKGIAKPSFAVLRKMLDGMGFDLHDLQDALDAVETGSPGSGGRRLPARPREMPGWERLRSPFC